MRNPLRVCATASPEAVFPPRVFTTLLLTKQWHTYTKTAVNLAKHTAGCLSAVLNRLFGSRSAGTIGILTYHRISPIVAGVPEPAVNVTPERFRRQIAGLLSRGFTIRPLGNVLECLSRGEEIPPQTIVVTFDDGYGCVHTNAWPVLRELNVPATVFVSTAYLDAERPFPFDPWATAHLDHVPVDTYRPLTTAQCREMVESGLIELGAHTHTHGDFRGRPDAFRRDLQTSVDVLQAHFGLPEVTFAFPYGRPDMGFVSDELIAAARQTGVTCALSTEMKLNKPQSDPFTWGRFNVDPWDNTSTLAAKLDGWYGWAPKLGRAVKCLLSHKNHKVATVGRAMSRLCYANTLGRDQRKTTL